jgi:hypothetical protein
MTPVNKKKSGKRINTLFARPNFVLFGLAALFILTGYWALSQEPVDGFLSLTLAPILLVIGYCVIIPFASMKSPKAD